MHDVNRFRHIPYEIVICFRIVMLFLSHFVNWINIWRVEINLIFLVWNFNSLLYLPVNVYVYSMKTHDHNVSKMIIHKWNYTPKLLSIVDGKRFQYYDVINKFIVFSLPPLVKYPRWKNKNQQYLTQILNNICLYQILINVHICIYYYVIL